MKKKNNQTKLKISKQQKKITVTVLVLLILANLGLILNEVMKKEITEENQVMSSFSNTPGISYQVFLKENALYTETTLSEDIGYFSNLIDHIEINFENKYQGEPGTAYKGDYMIIGQIVGLENGTEEYLPAWTKQFNITSKKVFQSTDDQLTISHSTNIDYNHFNTFTEEVEKLIGYNSPCMMKILMRINYTITTSEGEVTGSLEPAVTIPLGESYFKIVKSGFDEVKEDITKTVEVPVPYDYAKIILFSTICLLCFISLFLLLSSSEPTATDLQRRRIKKLLKIHGNRIVAIENALIYSSLDLCFVHSMADIVKISDEIERPIFYAYKDDPAEIYEFFVIDKEKVYLYRTIELVASDDQTEQREDANNKIAS
jgi:hypothetical protein